MNPTIRLSVVEHHPSGYRYLVTRDSASWTAFHTRAGVREFLRFYGLVPHYSGHWGRGKDSRWGRVANFTLEGAFSEFMLLDRGLFARVIPCATSWRMSNGERTLWKAVRVPGETRLYYLNPNVRDRPTVPYFND